MFLTRKLIVVVILSLFVVVSALGQGDKSKLAKTDLTGTWELVNSVDSSSAKLVIARSDSQIRVNTDSAAANGSSASRSFIFYSDGRGESNSFELPRQLTGKNGQIVDINTKTKSKGNSLIAKGSVGYLPSRLIGRRLTTYQVTEQWSLSENGKTLVWTTILDPTGDPFKGNGGINASSSSGETGAEWADLTSYNKPIEVVRNYRRVL